jgi:hypothetical protein
LPDSLGNKIRGALGTVLLRSASAAARERRPCDWDETCDLEMFFGRRKTVLLGSHASELAKPFVLSAHGLPNGELRIVLRLFGLACDRANAMADALVAALREHVHWSDLARDCGGFLPRLIDPENVAITAIGALGVTEPPPAAILIFHTPIDVERANPQAKPQQVIVRLMRRLALLTPWQGELYT